MKRYSKQEVDWAIEQTERNYTTPHGQIVLAGEVLALRKHLRNMGRCVEHGAMLYVAPGGDTPECWRCNEAARMRQELHQLHIALQIATECPVKREGDTKCTYRTIKQAQVAGLQRTIEVLRGELADTRQELLRSLRGQP